MFTSELDYRAGIDDILYSPYGHSHSVHHLIQLHNINTYVEIRPNNLALNSRSYSL